MLSAGVSNLGLDSMDMLLSIRRGSPIVALGRRGSSRAVGGGATGRGERRVGPVTHESLKGGVSIATRWRRRQLFDSITFRATAADDIEKEKVAEDEKEVEEAEAKEEDTPSSSSSSSKRQLSPKIKQQQQRGRGRTQAVPRTPRRVSNLVEEWGKREKGDVRDVVLMSLSFAVLIYISQHLVHAYCTLRHMYFNHY